MIVSSSAVLGVESIDQKDAMDKHSKLLNEYHRITFGLTDEVKDVSQSMLEELQNLIGSRGAPTEVVIDDGGTQYTGDLNSVSLETLIKQTRE